MKSPIICTIPDPTQRTIQVEQLYVNIHVATCDSQERTLSKCLSFLYSYAALVHTCLNPSYIYAMGLTRGCKPSTYVFCDCVLTWLLSSTEVRDPRSGNVRRTRSRKSSFPSPPFGILRQASSVCDIASQYCILGSTSMNAVSSAAYKA